MTRWWKAARLRRRLNHPTPALQLIVRRLRVQLQNAPGEALALVEIGSAEPAAVALASLAHLLASDGQRVVLADTAEGRPLSTLVRGSCEAGSLCMVSVKGQPVGLFVAPADPTRMADLDAGEDADVVLVLASIDPALGADHVAAWAGDAVVMVRAGEATSSRIDGVAKQLREARVLIRSAVLIGTDSDDYSSGLPAPRPHGPDPADLLLQSLNASGH